MSYKKNYPKNLLLKTRYFKCRGGVEDARLEAKDAKKSKAKAKGSLPEDRPSRGQGQKCSRPRPRTKNTAASVLRKKKGLQKSFSGNLRLIVVARIFDWEGLNHKSHAMTSSKFAYWHLTRILQRERA